MASGCSHNHDKDKKHNEGAAETHEKPAACGHAIAAIKQALCTSGQKKKLHHHEEGGCHHGHEHNHDSHAPAHSHDHAHDHSHDHSKTGGHHHHIPENFDRKFAIGATLNLAFVGAELTFGLAAHSMALLADAIHNFSDVIGLLMAWGALWMSRLSPTAERTYGYRSVSILAALGNAGLLFLATGAIIVEAVQRFSHPEAVASGTVILVAAIGILINAFTAFLFWQGQKDDLNIRGAFIHMLGDAAISVGVVMAAFVVGATGWLWMDPATSLIIAVVVILGSWNLAKEALHLSLGGVPRHIDRDGVLSYLSGLQGVTEVHDLHIWAMSTTETALTVHLLRPHTAPDDIFLHKTTEELSRRFKIHHATIQIEAGNAEDCPLAPPEAV